MEEILKDLPSYIEEVSLAIVTALTIVTVAIRKTRQALVSAVKRIVPAIKKLREAMRGPLPMLLLATVLVGCAGSQTPEKAHLTGCSAYDSTLRVLAAYRAAGELTESQVEKVNELRPLLNDLCSGPSRSVDEVIAVVDRHVAKLAGIAQEAKE